ncbi:MAG: 2-amino-4-hydroxy-6-hydroxymethyldihydropteridine diphosphokinase [Bacteroidaceae bacterium]|nr:2-amino-4-hydroxy-6-hydroxymethyldihydropteridine diphosphokinase [Bacteroidaceae bacterium]
MSSVYLSLGSNLGDRHTLLLYAIEALAHRVGLLVASSSFIETKPWGFDSPNRFLNAVVIMQTELTPRQLLNVTQDIERKLGRTHKSENGHYTDRPIDIDILLYGNEHINEPDLVIPHPRMQERDFVMHPLMEVKKHYSQIPDSPIDL